MKIMWEMMKMKVENAKVLAVKQRDENYSFMTKDGWFSGWGECPCRKGDIISFEWEQNGNFRNVKEIKVVESSQEEKEDTQKEMKDFKSADTLLKEKENLIIRQVAFKGAVEIISSMIKAENIYSVEGLTQAVKDYTNNFVKIIKEDQNV